MPHQPDQNPEALQLGDNHQRRMLRLRRQRMAVYSYLLVWGATLLGIRIGFFEPDTPHWLLFGATLAANLVFFLIIRHGISERWSDPSLTAPQMIVGIILITALLHYSRELRGAMIAVYFMAMTFGVFALSRHRMILMSAFVLLCFASLEAWEWQQAPQTKIISISFGHLSILLLGLLWFVYVGGHIRNLQQRNQQQRASLRAQQRHLEAINLKLQDAMAKLEEVAIRDPLTGLFNRRHFTERFDEEIARAERSGSPLHLALIDLDHFKQINDRHGHQAGDTVLRGFAETARQTLRRSDLLARYGGEEFVVLFTDGKAPDIELVLDRLRQGLATTRFGDTPGFQVTLSAGLASYRRGDTADTLTQRADRALYQAKHGGRNQLVAVD